jgi:HAE1 family hydrophobic/amphiphilic exporter-1
MFLSDFSIKRPIATIVLIVAMMCLGLMALNKLRVNQNPDVEVPFIVVNIPYPGASPRRSSARSSTALRNRCSRSPA